MSSSREIFWNSLEERLRPVAEHFQVRPLRYHAASWLIVGIALGLLLAPNANPVCLFSFVLSGFIVGGLMILPTYPMCDGAGTIILGAVSGTLITLILQKLGFDSMPNQVAYGCIIGALVASTSLPWLLAWRRISKMFLRPNSLVD